jgi:hypothetical protein
MCIGDSAFRAAMSEACSPLWLPLTPTRYSIIACSFDGIVKKNGIMISILRCTGLMKVMTGVPPFTRRASNVFAPSS